MLLNYFTAGLACLATSFSQALTTKQSPEQYGFTHSVPLSPPQTRTLGAKTRTPGAGFIQGTAGMQYALLLKPDGKKPLSTIQSVSFFIGESGFPRTKFRIHIYALDSASGKPGRDLLTDNLSTTAAIGGKWHTVDVAAYHIQAPEKGFFVAMEWLQVCPTATFQDATYICGQIVRPTFEFKDARTWHRNAENDWSLVMLASPTNPFNAMIRATVATR